MERLTGAVAVRSVAKGGVSPGRRQIEPGWQGDLVFAKSILKSAPQSRQRLRGRYNLAGERQAASAAPILARLPQHEKGRVVANVLKADKRLAVIHRHYRRAR